MNKSNFYSLHSVQLTSSECIQVLASICKMLSLATLSLCFPKSQFWQSNIIQEGANDYVNHFLSELNIYFFEKELLVCSL